MNDWRGVHQILPDEREHVQFRLAGQKAWLSGTYERRYFRFHWVAYRPTEVSAWRKVVPLTPRTVHDAHCWSDSPLRDAQGV